MNSERLNQIETLYHAALAIDEGKRGEFVRKSGRDDVELIAEVESLLAFERQSDSFIEETAVEIAAKSLTENRRESLLGENIGHYKIVSFLGAGGMGEVYCAVDEKLGRRVALKLLSPRLVKDAQYLRRFEREARTASALNHPNILTIFEIDSVTDSYFIATELIEGQTLRRRLLENQLSLPECLKICLQISEALAAAHDAGIVHRDIKPENVMIRPDGYVKVLDFGLAKAVQSQPNSNGESNLKSTVPGMIIGTPSYMSPEQVRGYKLDRRSDIFSLGVVLYEMISHKRPFAGATPSDVVAAILQRDPEPLAQLVSPIPPELERIVRKALSKDKETRYQEMSVLALDLKNLRTEINYASSSRIYGSGNIFVSQLNFFSVWKKWLVFSALSLALVIAIAAYFYAPVTRGEIDAVAVLPFVNSDSGGETDYLSDGLTESVIQRLSRLSDFKVMSFNSVLRYKDKEFNAQTIGRELNVGAILIGRLTQRGDDISINTELVNAADNSRIWSFQRSGKTSDILALQTAVSMETAERLNLKLSDAEKTNFAKRDTESSAAYQLYLQGRFFWNKRSADGLRRGIEFFNQAIEQDPNYALAYAGLADCYSLLSNYTDTPPGESMPKAKAAALKALEINESLAEAHTSLGNIKKEFDWDFAGAENSFKRAIEINPNYATAHQWRAENFVVLKRFDEAMESMRRALEVDPFSLIINAEVGWVLHHAGRYEEASLQLQKTIDLDPNFVRTHFFLGRVYEQRKMFLEAITETRKAIEISGGNALFRASLAHIYAKSGQMDDAKKILRELEMRATREYVSPFAFALIYTGLGQNQEALNWLETAYQQRDTILFNYIRDPEMDNLRNEPRFTKLLQRVNL